MALEPASAVAWPKKLADQTGVVLGLLGRPREALTTKQVTRSFTGAKEVADVLETLAALGHLVAYEGPDGTRWTRVGGEGARAI